MSDSLELRTYPPSLPGDEEENQAFLRARGLESPEGSPDYRAGLFDRGRLVGTASRYGKVIQALAVEEARAGGGLAARLVSELEAEAGRRGLARLFVFTSPGNRAVFEGLGYHGIAEAPGAALLLEKGRGLEDWLAEARLGLDGARARAGLSGPGLSVLVVNCNPFTLGHLHLARAAAAASAFVLVLVVREDASSFPYDVRFRLVREGLAGIANLAVLPGSDYLVSRATFPTYFLKDRAGEAAAIHARLDAELFGRRIAPALGVDRRFLGQEPYSPVTAIYNRVLAQTLPPLGIAVTEIPRLESGGAAVSASSVRAAIRAGRLQDARSLVPDTTWNYLISPEAGPVLEALRSSEGRH
jgi:[citrate (pro-3S)-lyase] ligase